MWDTIELQINLIPYKWNVFWENFDISPLCSHSLTDLSHINHIVRLGKLHSDSLFLLKVRRIFCFELIISVQIMAEGSNCFFVIIFDIVQVFHPNYHNCRNCKYVKISWKIFVTLPTETALQSTFYIQSKYIVWNILCTGATLSAF